MSEADDGVNLQRRLRILLIAYEFPPSLSPQSLRWAYLTRCLSDRGHDVHVMVPRLRGTPDALELVHRRVQLHKVYPGPIRALLDNLAHRRVADAASAQTGVVDIHLVGAESSMIEPPILNWKGRLLKLLQAAVAMVRFPDMRAEWQSPALAALPSILEAVKPDVVIASHEPATSLEIGLAAKRRGLPLIADLGDPVLAPYTPWWWRCRARRLEGRTLRDSNHVLVTSEATLTMLHARHGAATPISIVTQGFDLATAIDDSPRATSDSCLTLLYAGSFYPFRSPKPLVDAVLQVPGVRLDIASGNVPAWLIRAGAQNPDRIRLLGRLQHRHLLKVQRASHVLVNIANRNAVQVPGKVYEYFGACRPILHLTDDLGDVISELLASLNRGWSNIPEASAIASRLQQLVEAHRHAQLEDGLDLDVATVQRWSWSAASGAIERVAVGLVEHPGRDKLTG